MYCLQLPSFLELDTFDDSKKGGCCHYLQRREWIEFNLLKFLIALISPLSPGLQGLKGVRLKLHMSFYFSRATTTPRLLSTSCCWLLHHIDTDLELSSREGEWKISEKFSCSTTSHAQNVPRGTSVYIYQGIYLAVAVHNGRVLYMETMYASSTLALCTY